MGIHVIGRSGIGESFTEAEFVEVHAKVNDEIEPDYDLADVTARGRRPSCR